jgi:thioredoxin-dependent peroxiredoxin
MTLLKPGDKAPTFKTINEKGETVSLADFAGKKLVLYFYPQDNTPTCTIQACNIRDHYRKFRSKGYEVLGISGDDEKSHNRFIAKQKLPYSLLVDTEHKIAKKYGVWGEKQLFGRHYMGVFRTTFVIDEKGKIEQVIDKVVSKNHASQILG